MAEHGTEIVFPEQIDEPTQSKIALWFKFREVADNERFGDYFNRTLDEVAEQYRQLLRVEPGIATYDWLVQSYTEAQRKRKDEEASEKTTRITDDDYTGKVVSFGKQTAITGVGNDEETTMYGKGITKYVNENMADNISKEHHSGVDILNGSVVKNGAEVESGSDSMQSVDASFTHHDGDTVITDDGYVVNNSKSLAKVNPMSITYGSSQTPPVADPIIDHTAQDGGVNADGMPLDWTSPSSQGQEFGRDVNHSEHKEHDHDINISRNGISNGSSSKEHRFDDVTDTTEQTHGKQFDKSVEQSYNKSTGSTESTGGADTLQKKTDSLQTTENGGADVVSEQANRITAGQDSGSRDLTSKDQYRQTGRSEAPADIMKRAVVFITGTNAWKWLKDQLEVCFMGIYE